MKSWLLGSLLALSTCTVSSTALAEETTQQSHSNEQAISLISINDASIELLQTLRGIGAAKAQRIITFREEHGPFASVDELALVKGIGQKTVEKNRHLLTI